MKAASMAHSRSPSGMVLALAQRMSHSTIQLIWVFLVFSLGSGCQKSQPNEGERSGDLTVHVRLPASVAGSPARYEHFLKRVEFLEVELDSKTTKLLQFRFPAGNWESLRIGSLPLPEGVEAKFQLRLQVWDRKGGFRRSYPILKGEKTVRFEAQSVEAEAVVHLALQISEQNLD